MVNPDSPKAPPSAEVYVYPAAVAKAMEGMIAKKIAGRDRTYVYSFDTRNQGDGWRLSLKTSPTAAALFVRKSFGTEDEVLAAIQRYEMGETPDVCPSSELSK